VLLSSEGADNRCDKWINGKPIGSRWIKRPRFRLPPKILCKTYKSSDKFLKKKDLNQQQIQTLENLRDTLLPKLMSGEVRVQYQTEEVA
jgi:type I restriction enzyme S subunit